MARRVAVIHSDNSVSLTFDVNATYGESDKYGRSKLLRDFVSGMSGASWSKKTTTWELPDVYDYRPGTLKRLGFDIEDDDGNPVKREKRPPRPPRSTELSPLPETFNLPLYDYQREGSLIVAEKNRVLADAPGVGKTNQALASAAMLRSTRTLVVCPPVVVTHWSRTSSKSGLGPVLAIRDTGFSTPIEGATSTTPAKLKSSKTSLPDRGVVVVSTSLLSLQTDLHQMMLEWQPTVFIVDEAHSCKTWSSLRARRMRAIARVTPDTIPTTGTPTPAANPLEMAPLLEMTGDLQRLFGDFESYRDEFCYRSKFGWLPRKRELKRLRKILDEEVWIRRTKAEVLPGLPPKIRVPYWVDAINKEYKDALTKVYAEIDAWLKTMRWDPSDDEITLWAQGKVGLISRLRQAAGLAKVPAAVEFVAARPQEPILVWAHHQEVVERLHDSIPGSEMIYGNTTDRERDRLVDAYEAGEIKVLILSIQKVGVGVTLVRGNEALFVESDWTPDNITQAEDRQHRPGQEADHVTYTTMVCAGTIDENVQAVLTDKVERLDVLVSGDHAVNTEMELTGNVLVNMVRERRDAHWGRTSQPIVVDVDTAFETELEEEIKAASDEQRKVLIDMNEEW
jgi:SNF2 family DNA or RNA helicase